MTVLLWGVPSESPVAMLRTELTALGADVVSVAPTAAGVRADVGIDSTGALDGVLSLDGRSIDLAQLQGVYVRPVEPELAPGLAGRSPDSAELAHARSVHDTLVAFTEFAGTFTECMVANKLSAMSSNMSKPFQAQAIARHGFDIPDTVITDDPAEVLAFAANHREIIYKSTSGIRSVVSVFDPVADLPRLNRLRWCPVQFQARVPGPDVRVHVVGDEVFAAIVDTTAVDYRYARRQVGSDASLSPYQLAEPWAGRCVALALDLELPFAGIDLKLCPDGRVVCFEVNPSPGYSYFEQETGLPIARALGRWLLAE